MSPSDFKKLKATWYKKLKESGFEDIEADENTLKTYSKSVFFSKKDMFQNGGWQAKVTYYNLAARFLQEYKFKDALDKAIWEYHTEGLTLKEIAQTLIKLGLKKSYTVNGVWWRLNNLSNIMKKKYLIKYDEGSN